MVCYRCWITIAMVTVTILVGCATSAAPGDEDSSCDQTDPDSQKVLMDSNRYSFLLRSGGPWSQLSVDGDSVTWAYSIGGACARRVESSGGSSVPQNNFAFTQYIKKDIPQGQTVNFPVRIFVSVTTYQSCTPCGNPCSVNILHRITETEGDQTMNDNYQMYTLLRSVALPATEEFNFDLNERQNGFYLAFQDNTLCSGITRITVYRFQCPKRVPNSLTIHPASAASFSRDIDITPQCVSNAAISPSAESLVCTTMGEWVGNPLCTCLLGYVQSAGGDSCVACLAGFYRSDVDTVCQPCPENTLGTETNASLCSCLPGFSRNTNWPASRDCIQEPSSPAPVTTSPPEVKGNSITVSWLPSRSAGGCPDAVFYNVYLLREGDTEYKQHNDMGITAACPNNSSLFCYTISDLTTSSTYSVAIVAANCATSDSRSISDLRLVEGRFIVFYATTDVSALPAIGPSAAAGIAFVVTLFVTLIVTVSITAPLSIFLYCLYVDKKKGSTSNSNGHSTIAKIELQSNSESNDHSKPSHEIDNQYYKSQPDSPGVQPKPRPLHQKPPTPQKPVTPRPTPPLRPNAPHRGH